MSAAKRCRRCNKTKPLTEFGLHPRMRDGHQSYCKSCTHDLIRQGRSEGRYAKRENAQKAAYRAAEAVLRERHRDEFDDIYDTELVKRGIDPYKRVAS